MTDCQFATGATVITRPLLVAASALFICTTLVHAQARNEPGCSVGQFEIVSFSPRVTSYGSRNQYKELRLVGEIRNGCDVPMGVQIEIIARDADGVLVDSTSGWPASTSNIPAGGTTAINFTGVLDYRPEFESYEVRVIGIRRW